MLRKLQKHFGFHKKELNGIAVLLLLITVVWIAPLFYSLHDQPEPEIHELLEDDLEGLTNFEPTEVTEESSLSATAVHYFKFDPNKLATAQWQQLGLTDKQIKNIKNFEAKGGSFRKKEDLRKIYTLSQNDYKRLEPYIEISAAPIVIPARNDSVSRPKEYALGKVTADLPVLDLNKVDSLALLALPGIGPVFASRIVRYRDLLGGFHAISQLKEVYGLDTAKYQQIERYLQVDSADVKRIRINEVDFDELRKHPYISTKYARLMLAYRKQHGAYAALEDLSKIPVFDEKYLRKIAPYLNFNR
ncbi:helix-hairpin-helix domain-containing protein [Olivibacter sp. XZL3]|uniref:ComEA family DNA-binding protein n=1 Tax=Olivibacter sp. XZL3 TaxID=1735116 RepID=UPI001065611B|nr:helix-hairpin-helix domain-containing protein [Olivibacter sp. XZL3]